MSNRVEIVHLDLELNKVVNRFYATPDEFENFGVELNEAFKCNGDYALAKWNMFMLASEYEGKQ